MPSTCQRYTTCIRATTCSSSVHFGWNSLCRRIVCAFILFTDSFISLIVNPFVRDNIMYVLTPLSNICGRHNAVYTHISIPVPISVSKIEELRKSTGISRLGGCGTEACYREGIQRPEEGSECISSPNITATSPRGYSTLCLQDSEAIMEISSSRR